MKAHKSGINPGYLVTHSLRLSRINQEKANAIQNEIKILGGVDQVQVDIGKGRMIMAYDGSQHHIDEFLAIIQKHGVKVGKNWWNRVKLGFARQTDQNVKDNAGSHPACCSKPPGEI